VHVPDRSSRRDPVRSSRTKGPETNAIIADSVGSGAARRPREAGAGGTIGVSCSHDVFWHGPSRRFAARRRFARSSPPRPASRSPRRAGGSRGQAPTSDRRPGGSSAPVVDAFLAAVQEGNFEALVRRPRIQRSLLRADWRSGEGHVAARCVGLRRWPATSRGVLSKLGVCPAQVVLVKRQPWRRVAPSQDGGACFP